MCGSVYPFLWLYLVQTSTSQTVLETLRPSGFVHRNINLLIIPSFTPRLGVHLGVDVFLCGGNSFLHWGGPHELLAHMIIVD